MSIDIGSPAIYGTHYYTDTNYTRINKVNPANGSGKITSVQIYAHSAMTGLEVGIFYVLSGNNLTCRSYATIGNVGAGYSQHNVNLTVEAGDFIGFYCASGLIRLNTGTFPGNWQIVGDYIPCTNTAFANSSTTIPMALYGTGYILVKPSVVTNEVTGIRRVDPSKVNANGNVNNDGSEGAEKVTTRGFKYGLTQADTWDIHEDGAWNEGVFSLEITEHLDPDTIYYVRAYADNIKGRSFGSYVQFRTAVPYWSTKIEIKAEATASDEDIVKVGGKKTLPINNHLIQDMSIAQNIANSYLSEYKDQKIIMVVDLPIPLPYEIGDTIEQISTAFASIPYKPAAEAEIGYKPAIEAEIPYKPLDSGSKDLIIRKINLRFSAGNFISTIELEG